MAKKIKILIPLLLALAIALGLIRHSRDPYFGWQKKTFFAQKRDTDKSLDEYLTQAKNLTPAPQKISASFLAVGDIMLSRNVAFQIKKSGNVNLPFSKMADILKSVNFSFGNLESPISSGQGIVGGHSMIFSSPSGYAGSLADYNFKILNLTNNHALDQGIKGLSHTLKYLDENNIKHVGAGQTLDQAWQPAVIEEKGIKICFVGASYSSINDNGKTTNSYVARIEDIENLKHALSEAEGLKIENSKSLCDFVVATMHVGTEYTRRPNQAQKDFAHAAIDYGADMVVGHHPHWMQTIEKYCPSSNHPPLTPPIKGGETADSLPLVGRAREGEKECKYIFYSLGNFIFDQMWSQETKEGLTLKITLSAVGNGRDRSLQGPRVPAELESIELIPIIIENYSTPRPATAEESKKILEKIGAFEKILK